MKSISEIRMIAEQVIDNAVESLSSEKFKREAKQFTKIAAFSMLYGAAVLVLSTYTSSCTQKVAGQNSINVKAAAEQIYK